MQKHMACFAPPVIYQDLHLASDSTFGRRYFYQCVCISVYLQDDSKIE